MPIGGEKVGVFAAGVSEGNYFGDESLGNCQFSSGSITQTGDTTAIDTVLTTGSESGGVGSSSYGAIHNGQQNGGIKNASACYEFTVLNKSGSYDGDMVVLNFIDLTIDSSITITTDQPCRGLLVYVSGNADINGCLSMTCRGAYANPTTSGGSDSSAVSATGLRLPMLTASGTDTLAAADFAGSGNAAVAAVANQPGIGGDGSIFRINQLGTTGAGPGPPGGGATAAPTGANTIGTGGGASGRGNDGDGYSGTGGDAGAFGGGSASGSTRHATSQQAIDYGGAGTSGAAGATGEGVAGGSGNPGGSGVYGGGTGGNGTGGMCWLVVKGNLDITGGLVDGCGAQGSSASHYGGSGSGGGALMVLYAGTGTNITNRYATEGAGGTAAFSGHAGGRGGAQSAATED